MKVSVLAAIASCVLFAAGIAGPAEASIRKTTNIPAESLSDALRTLAKDRQFEILYRAEVVRDVRTEGAIGEFTPEEALKVVLSGTGLSYKYLNANTVTVFASSAASSPSNSDQSSDQGGNWEKTSQGFRVAQVDQGKGSQSSAVANQASNSPESSSGPSPGLAEIVVTAQKREQRLIDVPMSISAVTGDTLAQRGISNAQDLSFAIPGLQARDWGGGRMDISIRGINSSRGTSSLTGLYLDEAPLSGTQFGDAADYINVQALDLKRVEVLKGPQGTLFGEGAVGGVVRYITNDPEFTGAGGEFSASSFATAGGNPSAEGTLVLNLPVTDTFALRIAALYQDHGGWIDNTGTGERNFNDEHAGDLRAKVLWNANSDLTIRALAEISRDRGGGNNQVFAPYSESRYFTPIDTNLNTDYSNDHDIYNLTINYNLGFAELLSSTSYLHRNSDGAYVQHYVGDPPPGATFGAFDAVVPDVRVRGEMTTQELRLTSTSGGALNWVAGAIYKDDNFSSGFPQGLDAELLYGAIPLSGYIVGQTTDVKTKTGAAFADASYTFFERLTLGGGLRYSSQHVVSVNTADSSTPAVTQSADFSKLTYRAYARYAVTREVNLYINVANGYRSGGFNASAAVAAGGPPTYGPENSINYEAGIKSEFLDGRAQLNLAAYTSRYKDQLQDTLVSPCATCTPVDVIANAGEAKINGFEWDFRFQPVSSLTIGVSGEKIDTKFISVSPQAPVLVGDRLAGVPGYDFQLSGNYKFHWTAQTPGDFEIDYSNRGSTYSYNRGQAPLLPEVDRSFPLRFMDASLGMQLNGIQFRLFGRNLLDERNPINTGSNTIGTYTQARPRNVGISVSKSF